MAKKKKHCTPEILRRIFGDRAQPLLRTIISLLTPSQALAGSCKWCSDNRCLNCSVASGEAEALSFLLRPEDPSDYRNLLTDCFIVVEEDAPRIDGCCPLNPYEWTQHVMVQRTIEMIQYETPKSNNVLCTGYRKILRSSTILDCLTSAAWCLLLKRVGASVMYRLLRSASIFLPVPCQKYLQVAGPPITNLRHTLRRKQSPLDEELGAKKKRKVGHTKLFLDGGHVNSFGIGHASMLSTDSQRSIATSVESASCPTFFKDNSHAPPDGLVQTVPKSRKRERPFKWQRRKRKKQLKALENGIDVTSRELHSDGSLNSTPIEMPVLCSCCLKLQEMKKLDHGTLIERNKMFYNLETLLSVFPESHGLTILKPDVCGSTSLVHEIFELPEVDRNTQTITCFHNSNCCRICSSCPYHSMIKLLKKLIRRSCYRDHLKLLDKHCPLPLSTQDASQVVESEVDKTVDSIESCSAHQVASFVWAVLRSIVPLNLLGDERTLRRNIYRFIGLRRFEKFSVKQCLHKVKSSMFDFFTIIDPQISSSAKTRSAVGTMMSDLKQSILNKWIYWVFSSLVVPLVQSNFYVTESEHGKQEMYYFRKSAWKEMTDGAINDMQSNMMCRNMNEANVRKIVGKRCFGFSKLRFVQKGKNGLRMLANLKASSIFPASSYSVQRQTRLWKKKKQGKTFNGVGRLKSVNSGLRKTLAVLKGIKLKEPERLVGSCVSDYNEVYSKLCTFILNLKKKKKKADDSYVYLVACDVRKAYDSINQDKLLNIIMRDVVTEAEYPLIESSELIITKNSSLIRDNFRPAALNLTTGLKFCTSSARSVLIDKGKPNIVKGEEILSDIKEVVQKSILKLENKFYLQTVGIPQGSIISSSLCSFYYGHLERNVIIPFLDRGLRRSNGSRDDDATPPVERLLLRFMDDFLFLTNSKEQATLFFTRLKRGFRDYNCYMNDEKFFLNFAVGENVSLNNISQKRRAHVSQDGSTLFLKWSGLLINSATLEVQSDYSKYLSSHVRSTLTVSWQKNPELELKKKLFGFLRPKFHPILIDSNINSAAIVRLNIYQVFLLSAMKFHCYVCALSYFCKSSSSLHFDMIKQSFRYMWGLIKRWMRRKYNDVRPVVKLNKREVEWLGLVAFVRVLKRKQSRHKQLIASLISELSKHKISRSVSPDLNYAIDKSHSCQLWELRY